MLYDIVYDFFDTYVWTNSTLSSMNIDALNLDYNAWLCHTCTIATMIMGVVFMYLVVRWIFRVFAGLVNV